MMKKSTQYFGDVNWLFGFTLIELLLTVAIVSTIAVFSTSFYARFLTQNAVLNATDQLVQTLRKAQLYSMMGKQNGQWGVSYANHTITLFLQGNPSFNEYFSVNGNIIISGFTSLTYSKTTGLPSTTPTITIQGGSTLKTISINSVGVVSRNN